MISKVIDLSLSLPPSQEEIVKKMKSWAMGRGVKGLENYRYIFGPARARAFGVTIDDLEKMSRELSPNEFEDFLLKKAEELAVSPDEFVQWMDESGVERGVITTESNDRTADLVAKYPQKFIGQARVISLEGIDAVRELERAVKDLGMKCFYAPNFSYGVYPNDKKLYPLYAKATEMNIPVFIYTTMNYSTSLPMDLGRPLYVDEVARDFPEMTIIAALAGWPWVPEMIGVARRNQNIYIDTADHRPKYFGTPGSGWEMLIQFGNTLLQDRIVFASSWADYFTAERDVLKKVIQEMNGLPLKDDVKEKWLYKNAARLFCTSSA